MEQQKSKGKGGQWCPQKDHAAALVITACILKVSNGFRRECQAFQGRNVFLNRDLEKEMAEVWQTRSGMGLQV